MSEGYGVRAARIDAADEETDDFLRRIGVLAGKPAPAPEYGQPTQVDAQAQAIFDEACGSYPMPLGKPVSVAKAKDGEHFIFRTASQTPDGKSMEASIYVVRKAGGKAEFTRAVR